MRPRSGLFATFALVAVAALQAGAQNGLYADGNVLRDAVTGEIFRLQGVNVPSMEWTNEGDPQLPRSVQIALENWNANVIRLPLNQDRWFGRAPGQNDGGARYRQIVDGVVQACADHNAYVLIDLHWSDLGQWGANIGQHRMPDQNSVVFWSDAATRYANHPAVLFDLYNEPHDVSWEIWRDGGTVSENGRSYAAPGLQELADVVRRTGAGNLLVIAGLDWGYDLSGIARGYALNDAGGSGILYDSHIYPWKGNSAGAWDPHVAVIADQYPVVIGEVGCEPDGRYESPYTWAPRVLDYIAGYQFSWIGWCFHPAATPRLLQNWDYTPTPYWGDFVLDALRNR